MPLSETRKGDLFLVLSAEADPAIEDLIRRQIKEFNNRVSEHHRRVRTTGLKPLYLLIRDGADRIVGGLTASTYWGWLEIDNFWLSEELRRQGLGREMLRMAEAEAVARGCSRATLRTFSFQARQFYEKQGYRVVGALEDYPPGEALYWMRKDLNL